MCCGTRVSNGIESCNRLVVGSVAGGIDGSSHGEFCAKGAVNSRAGGGWYWEGLCAHRKGGGMYSAKEEVPGYACEGWDRFTLGAVVETDGALLGISSNPCDNGEGSNGINVVLKSRVKGGEGGCTKEPCTIITVGRESQWER